jgi:hypothetical protein
MRFLRVVLAALAIVASFTAGVNADDTHIKGDNHIDHYILVDKNGNPLSTSKVEHVSNNIAKKMNKLDDEYKLFTFNAFDQIAINDQFVSIYAQDGLGRLIDSGAPFEFYGTTSSVEPTSVATAGDHLATGLWIAFSLTTNVGDENGANAAMDILNLPTFITPTTDNGGPSPNGAFATWHYDVAGTSHWPAPGPRTGSDVPYNWLSILVPITDGAQVNIHNGYIARNSPTFGDPQFNGMQGQSYQFHGMADEVFSLVSSPDLQMNSLFKFISSGTCNYNDTVCWSHPGTYLGQIGIQYGADTKILFQSGSHADGMRVFVNDKEISVGQHLHRFTPGNSTHSRAIMQFNTKSTVEFDTDAMFIRLSNSDYFFNLDFGLKNSQVLIAGSKQLTVSGEVCELESRLPKDQLSSSKAHISKLLKQTYPSYPLHGLIGQTWRNAVYCGRYYEGSVDDYVTGGLFSNEHTFNFFNKA